MMRLRLLTPGIAISILIVTSCSQDESASLMPVTTDSELALEFYETGQLAFDQIKFELAHHNFELAVKEDPNFFMAHFWLYFMSAKGHRNIGEEALQTEADLNEGEKQIWTALKYLRDGQEEKVVNHLKMAVDLYPSDPHVHKILYILQSQYLKDPEGALESINRTLEVQPGYASAYNHLGYVLMELDELDRAEKAFDTYIKLEPSIANPYDSKGDYYMHTAQYQEAYDSYMKASEIDCDCIFSEKKARKAKYLLEKTSGV